MADNDNKIDIEQVVAAYNQLNQEYTKAKKMIDKLAVKVAQHSVEITERDVVIESLREMLSPQQTSVSEEE